MPKKPGRGGGPRKNRRGPGGPPPKGRGRGPGGPKGRRPQKSDYFMQPGKRGVFVVLRRPIGNRAHAKVCGSMPSRVHAKMLIDSLQRAESVVKDLFMEATDDGIEALEAILAATCEDVMKRGPKVAARPETAETTADDDTSESEESPPSDEDDEDPYAEEEEET